MASVLEFEKITYYYESGGKRIGILENVDCTFEQGILYTIVSPSGSGKTKEVWKGCSESRMWKTN